MTNRETNGNDLSYPFDSFFASKSLTKREYFAAMAMQGLVSDSDNNITYDTVAEFSVMMADKLISELNKLH